MADNDYQNTISGLLRRKAEVIATIEKLRDETAEQTNVLRSIDRVLLSLDYKEDLAPRTIHGKRVMLYERQECRRFILKTLREASEPLSSRQLANELAIAEGKDNTDRKLMTDLVRRISKSVNLLVEKGIARRVVDLAGRYAYHLAGPDPELTEEPERNSDGSNPDENGNT